MSGVYLFQAREPNVDLHRMARLLSSQLSFGREPVNHYAVSQSCLLGIVSARSLQPGVMPRYVNHDRLWGVLQGTLYDCDFLSDWRRRNGDVVSDLDVFARMFRDGDLADHLPRMNGAFFVVLWDPENDTLVAANDRFGLYPMYWSDNRRRFCLASRVLCSVLAGVVTGDWDPAGVAQLLTTNDFTAETTLVRGVETFPQATMLVKQGDDTLTWRRYWQYDYTPRKHGVSLDDLGRELGEHFVRSVRRQTTGIQRVGVTLSGGLDSRCIVAASAKAGVPAQTFTWGEKGCLDREFAREVAQVFGTTHHDCEADYRDYERRYDDTSRVGEGFTNVFDTHMLAHLHMLEGSVDLILNGYAGDLVLGGSYLRHKWMETLSEDDLVGRVFEGRIGVLPETRLGEAMPDPNVIEKDQMPSALYRHRLGALRDLPTPDRIDRFFLENRVRRHTAIGTVLLRCGVESAACFFDYDLIDLTTSIPAALRREHRVYLAMMRQAFPEALKVRWQRTFLPAGAPVWQAMMAKGVLKGCRILARRFGWPRFVTRQAPGNFSVALRGPLRNWMERVCREPSPLSDEVLKPEFRTETWKRHLSGDDQTAALGTIAALCGFAEALAKARSEEPASPSVPEDVGRL